MSLWWLTTIVLNSNPSIIRPNTNSTTANSHILTSSAIIIGHENAHYCVPRYRPVLAFQMVPQAWNFWNCPKIMKPKETLLRLFFDHFEFCNSFPHGFPHGFSCTHFCCYFLTFMIYRNLSSLTELTHEFPLKTNKIRLSQHFMLFFLLTWLFSDSLSQKDSSIQVPFIQCCCFWAWGMKNGR